MSTRCISPGDNKLNFRFAGEYRRDCNDLFNEILWARISDMSQITLTTVRIAPERKLSRLPAPFFDPNLRSTLRVPVVLPDTNSKSSLKAAGLVASWFGKIADFRKLSFPVFTAIPASGNAVEVGENLPVDEAGTRPRGPMLAEIANPNDRWGTILVVTGRNAQPKWKRPRSSLVFLGRYTGRGCRPRWLMTCRWRPRAAL
ncbi:cellulose biosynthesis cyclic di-GMP-binding regulatory protein BcsB [Komagataeibacter rhaeticus]